MRNKLYILFIVTCFFQAGAQSYPPPPGVQGSTAIYKDSSAFVNWASGCAVIRGYQDISNPVLGFASAGDSSMVFGKAQDNGIVSLGDGGWATCTFPLPIMNGPGFDFAVFENAFDDFFLELAFVEVSSDGINFFRFPSHSLTDTSSQTGSFDSTDTKLISNLAGKYRGAYGTPFDLQELSAKPGLDLNAVRFVRILDVVGSMLPQYARRDSYGNKVNDPWPTPFPTSGFDLDAIGVIHQNNVATLKEENLSGSFLVYPNPAGSGETISLLCRNEIQNISLYNSNGILVHLIPGTVQFQLPSLPSGLYMIEVQTTETVVSKKILIR